MLVLQSTTITSERGEFASNGGDSQCPMLQQHVTLQHLHCSICAAATDAAEQSPCSTHQATVTNPSDERAMALTIVLGSRGDAFVAELAVTAPELEPDVTQGYHQGRELSSQLQHSICLRKCLLFVRGKITGL